MLREKLVGKIFVDSQFCIDNYVKGKEIKSADVVSNSYKDVVISLHFGGSLYYDLSSNEDFEVRDHP